jgi:FimV-like protein
LTRNDPGRFNAACADCLAHCEFLWLQITERTVQSLGVVLDSPRLVVPQRASVIRDSAGPPHRKQDTEEMMIIRWAFVAWAAWAAVAAAQGGARPDAAVLALENAVARGDVNAMMQLASKYEYADGVPQDYDKANALYCRAAALGNAQAEVTLGLIYLNGRNVAVNESIAAALFRRAADHGNAHANDLLRPLTATPATVLPACLGQSSSAIATSRPPAVVTLNSESSGAPPEAAPTPIKRSVQPAAPASKRELPPAASINRPAPAVKQESVAAPINRPTPPPTPPPTPIRRTEPAAARVNKPETAAPASKPQLAEDFNSGPVQTTPPTVPESASPAAASHAYVVKDGDTLFRIAVNFKPDGVTLEQMLVSIYRNNPDAFGGNMNRMISGTILRIPQLQQITDLPAQQAARETHAQMDDWNTYRAQLAAAADAPQEASLSTNPAPDMQATSRQQTRDVLKLSSSAQAAGASTAADAGTMTGATTGAGIQRDEVYAREQALKEANARIAQLEKALEESRRLLALRGQSLPEAPGDGIAASASDSALPSATSGATAAPAPAPKGAAPLVASAPEQTPAVPRLVVMLLAAMAALWVGALVLVWRRRRARQI